MWSNTLGSHAGPPVPWGSITSQTVIQKKPCLSSVVFSPAKSKNKISKQTNKQNQVTFFPIHVKGPSFLPSLGVTLEQKQSTCSVQGHLCMLLLILVSQDYHDTPGRLKQQKCILSQLQIWRLSLQSRCHED